MTQPLFAVIAAFALLTGGCAVTGGKSAAEAAPGKFVTYNCADKHVFSVRFDAENGTARIRTHEGSAELSKGSRGLFRDDDGHWLLTLAGGSGTELVHNGKAKYRNCTAS